MKLILTIALLSLAIACTKVEQPVEHQKSEEKQ